MSLAQIQEIPLKNMVLLVGPPGSGKSTFCKQATLQNLTVDTPVIYVVTEYGPSDAEKDLREKGLGEVESGLLNYVNAYHETVGLSTPDRTDTLHAHCEDLSSIDIAISKLSTSIGRKGVLLIFDSLTSPYLFSGPEILRFMRSTLSKFAAEENAVLACIDEGCGKEEDLVAMMSLSNGIIKIEIKDGKTVLNIVKHPKVNPIRIKVPIDKSWEKKIFDAKFWDRDVLRRLMKEEQVHSEFKVNIFWPNLAFWSCMNWDPKRFPTMTYEVWKEFGGLGREMLPLYPWYKRFFLKIFTPKDFSKVKDMKKISKLEVTSRPALRGDGILEYLDDISKTDEHYFRIYESRECWGFGNVAAALSSIFPPMLAGFFKGLESWRGLERDWNIIETKCIGLGDPHCEFKLIPGEIDDLKDSLEKDISIIEIIHGQLMDRLRGFLLYDTPFKERPRLGNYYLMEHPDITLPAMAGERYRMALRMGGARVGKEIGENLIGAGIREDEAVKRILKLFNYCKVGKVSVDETIRIKENCESLYTKYYMTKWEEPLCLFTTGFFNGFFLAVKNKHLKETKCIATGDPYCEWEFS